MLTLCLARGSYCSSSGSSLSCTRGRESNAAPGRCDGKLPAAQTRRQLAARERQSGRLGNCIVTQLEKRPALSALALVAPPALNVRWAGIAETGNFNGNAAVWSSELQQLGLNDSRVNVATETGDVQK
jgi:hypothetical protein